jgi:signal transduction histidine kinase
VLQDATLDLLKFKPFPALAQAVRASSEAILSRWQALVCDKLPSADELTRTQLRDELPQVLAELADTLAEGDGRHFDRLKSVAQSHGQVRFHQSYNISELLVEYGMLRSILLDEVVMKLGRDLTVSEAAAVNMGIDTAIRNGVTNFTAFQEQRLKAVVDAQSKNLSFLSHDLRGGLNGVLLMVEVLKRELANEPKFSDSIHDLDSMRQSILDTVSTMDRFLHAERFRQGKVQPHNTTVQLSQVLSDLQLTYRHQAESKGIRFIVSDAAKSVAYTDREILLLILQNFVANAIKYTSKGTVELKAEKSPSATLTLSVVDTGPGIAADRLNNLFAPYIRGETHGQDGVGLGLSIAKQAADLIGASIRVESTVGTGSSFILELA